MFLVHCTFKLTFFERFGRKKQTDDKKSIQPDSSSTSDISSQVQQRKENSSANKNKNGSPSSFVADKYSTDEKSDASETVLVNDSDMTEGHLRILNGAPYMVHRDIPSKTSVFEFAPSEQNREPIYETREPSENNRMYEVKQRFRECLITY